MSEKSLSDYVLYKGEAVSPYRNESNETFIWNAERSHYTECTYDCEVRNYVEAFVGKWDPFFWKDIMDYYDSLVSKK